MSSWSIITIAYCQTVMDGIFLFVLVHIDLKITILLAHLMQILKWKLFVASIY